MNKTVYIVTEGSYSDYHIIGVFEDEDLAKEYARQNRADVEEHIVKTDTDLELPRGYLKYEVHMRKNGDVISVTGTIPFCTDDCDNVDFSTSSYKKSSYVFKTGTRRFYVSTDMGEEGAIKIANERRIQLIAENKWPIHGEKI